MAVGFSGITHLTAIPGIRLSSVAAGIRYQNRDDLLLIEISEGSQCAAVFTRNAFCAAPVLVARKHLENDQPRYLLINSGNANAGTGAPGLLAAESSCAVLAESAGCNMQQVLPFSTGVIGEQLPVERITVSYPALLQSLDGEQWLAAARAIMTTDTLPKGISLNAEINGTPIHITGIAKGSGMIRPDMATMLAFLATDVQLESAVLNACLQQAVDASFNRITVDGDTSTNDSCVLIASGQSGVSVGDKDSLAIFRQLLTDACVQLAQMIVRDGEGASKFVTVTVEQGQDSAECLQVAYTIAHSPLVKTALFASDPNWGRILAAIGRAGIEHLQIDAVDLYLDDVCIVSKGAVAEDYSEQRGQAVFDRDEFTIRVLLGRGKAVESIWTCDLSHDYVSINADYRS